MPALIAKAVGEGKNGLETKGVQVTFLDEKGNKAALEHPVRYSGSSNAIIMLQKPTQKDNRWYLTPDIETGLTIVKSNPDIRVASLATQERFNKNPLQGKGKKELIFCVNFSTLKDIVNRVVRVFSGKGFNVSLAKPGKEKSFNDLLKTKGKETVCSQLSKTALTKSHVISSSKERDHVIEL
jgi:hypothetical protein